MDDGVDGRRMTVGVFGGSFNPPHNGHIALARAVVEAGLADKVLMVLSPLNPLKARAADLASDADRYAMLRLAVGGTPGLEASDMELSMPRPSYTADTLDRLAAENPGCRFRLIVGADNWAVFDRWRRGEHIVANYAPIVYPRPGVPLFDEEGALLRPGAEVLADMPLFPVSGTEIRSRVAQGLPVNNFLAPEVLEYINVHRLYKQ